jgi:hypothetical protein
VAPKAGLLLLFPASVDHAVLDNGSEEERRVSIAMDFCLSAPASQGAEESEYLAPHPSTWLEVVWRSDPAS